MSRGCLPVLDPQNPDCASNHKPSPREINLASTRETEPSTTGHQGRPCHQVTSSKRGLKGEAGVPRPPAGTKPPVLRSHSGWPGTRKRPRWVKGLGPPGPTIPPPRGPRCGQAPPLPLAGGAERSPVTQQWAAEKPQALRGGGHASTPAPGFLAVSTAEATPGPTVTFHLQRWSCPASWLRRRSSLNRPDSLGVGKRGGQRPRPEQEGTHLRTQAPGRALPRTPQSPARAAGAGRRAA